MKQYILIAIAVVISAPYMVKIAISVAKELKNYINDTKYGVKLCRSSKFDERKLKKWKL